MALWYVAGPIGSAALGDHHPAIHAGVQGAAVAELPGLGEAVAEGAPGLDLGGEAVALDVVGDRAVDEPPGDLGAGGDLDGRGQELEVLGVDRRHPAHRWGVGGGGGRAGLAGRQCEREHKQERGEGAGGAGWQWDSFVRTRYWGPSENATKRIPPTIRTAVSTSSTMAMMRAALASSRPPRRPSEAWMRFSALLAMTRATTAPTGGQMKKPTMAMTSAAVAELSVGGPAG